MPSSRIISWRWVSCSFSTMRHALTTSLHGAMIWIKITAGACGL
jgi:hypothetical protein